MREIPLTQGKVALVDDKDYQRLSVHSWHTWRSTSGVFYARRTTKNPSRVTILMHQEVIGKPEAGLEIDHKDRDGLNNQRSNLRFVTHSENMMGQKTIKGTSRFKGVSWRASSNKWRALIRVGGRLNHLGYFTDEEDAARAYDAAALEHFGEFARLNFGRF